MGSCWDDLFCLPKSWWQLPVVERYHKEIAKIVLQEFGRHEIWAIKDPRISILLPLWIDIFNRLSIVPHFLIAIRNPFEVARSLMARDRFCQSKSLALWMKYFLKKDFTTAVSSFQKAIELSPGYELAHNNLRRLKQRISDL